MMELTVEHLEGGLKKLNLKGRLDIEGTEKIGLSLSVETSVERSFVIMDLSQTDFMSSVGIGMLVRSAKALRLRGGNAVLFNPQPVVALVLKHTQIDTIIPVCYDLQEATQTVVRV